MVVCNTGLALLLVEQYLQQSLQAHNCARLLLDRASYTLLQMHALRVVEAWGGGGTRGGALLGSNGKRGKAAFRQGVLSVNCCDALGVVVMDSF